MELLVILLNLILTTFTLFILLSMRKRFLDSNPITPPEENIDIRELSPAEVQRLKRDNDFDERILRLKDEIADKHPAVHQYTVAEELHPAVHNLPHDIIDVKINTLPDVEVSE